MDYKREYSKEEVTELVDWFKTRKFEQDLDLGSGLHITELDKTITQFTHLALNSHGNPVFSGPITMLFRIREELIKQKKIIEEQ